MPRLRAGSSRDAITLTSRLLGLAEALGRWGPLTRGQLLRVLSVLVSSLVHGTSADRLLRRDLDRLRKAGFLGERAFPGIRSERVLWLTEEGQAFLSGLGRLPEVVGDVVTRYFGKPVHNRLVKDVAVTFVCARHAHDLAPPLTRLAWEEGVVWTVADPDVPVPATDLEPDGLAWIKIANGKHLVLFPVEADCGEERLHGRWAEKVEKYRAWHAAVRTGRFTLPLGVAADAIRVLVVTPSPVRARHLAEVTAQILKDSCPVFLNTTPAQWTPATFWDAVWLPAGCGQHPDEGSVRLPGGAAPSPKVR